MGEERLPEVSVIIPTYNRAGMLAEAINSVLGQSFRDLELIVMDDGSTDGTQALLCQWAGRIETLRTGRHGVSAARNAGAARARGRWLAFLDSDDLWLPEKLELQLAAHHAAPELLCSHTAEIWVRRGVRVNPMRKHARQGGWIFEHCLPMCRISPSSVLIDRWLFQRLGGFDRRFRVCEDYELWLRLTALFPVLYLDRPLVIKRGGHADQLSASHWGFDRFRVRALVKILGTDLKPTFRLAALRELSRKARILFEGCRKRGKNIQASRYARLAEWADSETGKLESPVAAQQ